ncbi:hypothetical protein DdX_19668 [Ditylenchus destructor]|uniref:Uncharacterized protein n=1 Tax=Ditylenchus destructor TaxID=166010 RepID=A0AAD4MI10_9BILA|nr:hypothetical protein DdX_19668 [Ditylenchus destructor]
MFMNITTFEIDSEKLAVNFTCTSPQSLDKEETMQPWSASLGWRSSTNFAKISNTSITCSTVQRQVILPDKDCQINVYYHDDRTPELYSSNTLFYFQRNNNNSFMPVLIAIHSKHYNDEDSFPNSTKDTEKGCFLTENMYNILSMCNNTLMAEEYSNSVPKTKFLAKRPYKVYYVYGRMFNNVYALYEYYTHFHYHKYIPSAGFMFCNKAYVFGSSVNAEIINTTLFEIAMWPTPNNQSIKPLTNQLQFVIGDLTCTTLDDMEYYSEPLHSLLLHFYYKHKNVTQITPLLPIDSEHWIATFVQNKCIKVQMSVFHHYCFCMGTNKSERFCKKSKNFQPISFGNLGKLDDPISSNTVTPTSNSTESPRKITVSETTLLNSTVADVYKDTSEEEEWIEDDIIIQLIKWRVPESMYNALLSSFFYLGILAHIAQLIDASDSSSSSGADLSETLENPFSVFNQEPESDSSWETSPGCSDVLHDVDKLAYCFFYNFGYQPGHFDSNLDDLKDQASWENGYEVISNFIQKQTGCDIARFKLIQQSIDSSEENDSDKTGCLQYKYKTLSSSIPAIHIQQTLTGSYNNFSNTFNPEADVCSKTNGELQSTESSLMVDLDEENQLQVEINAYAGHTIIRLSESRDPKIGIQRWIRLHCYTCGAFLDVVEHCKKRRIEYGNAGCGGPEDDSYGVIPGDEGQCKNS